MIGWFMGQGVITMTAQFLSSLTLDDVSYRVTDAKPYPIFHPDMLGIEVSPMNTGCWAGFLVEYEYKDDQLFARSMNLGVYEDEPLVNGVKPDPLLNSEDPILDLVFGRHYTMCGYRWSTQAR